MNDVVSGGSGSVLPFADRLLDTVIALAVAAVGTTNGTRGDLLHACWTQDQERVDGAMAVIMDAAIAIHLAAAQPAETLMADRDARQQTAARARAQGNPGIGQQFSCLGVPPDIREELEYRGEQLDANALKALRLADLKYLEKRGQIYWQVVEAGGRDVTIDLTAK